MDTDIEVTELAYLAGIVDGEGYIGIGKRMPGRNKMSSPRYSCRLSIAMCEPDAINLLMNIFGINRNILLRSRFPSKHRSCWSLQLEQEVAAIVLKSLLPYLRIKAEQAMCALELREIQRGSRKSRIDYRMVGSAHRYVGATPRGYLSVDHLQKCEFLYLRCKEMNKRGPRKGEGTE